MEQAVHEEASGAYVLFVLATSILFFYAPKVKSVVSARAAKLASPPPVDPSVTALLEDIRRNEDELNKISPTSEFAAYFKKERQVNKLKDDLAALMREKPQETNSKELMKIEILVRLFFNFAGFLLLYLVAGAHAFCMDSWIFWPINYMLRFPSVLSAGDVCGGPDSGLVPVSYFVVFYVFTAVLDRFTGRFNR